MVSISQRIRNWWNSVAAAAPVSRNFDISYVPLYRTNEAGQDECVGSFVPELYNMALAGRLKCQYEEMQWLKDPRYPERRKLIKDTDPYRIQLKNSHPVLFKKLYEEKAHLYYRRKSLFELAVVPTKNMEEVGHFYREEFMHAREKRIAFSPFVSKLRAKADYLQNIADIGLKAGDPVGYKVNIKNKANTITLPEKLLHYSAQWAAWITPLMMGIGTAEWLGLFAMAPTLTAVGLFTIVMAGTWLARKYAMDFGYYEMAEGINRDINWLFDKEAWRGKFSFQNTVKTLILLSCLGGVLLGASYLAWTGALALPIAKMMATGEFSTLLMNGISLLIAGFSTAITFLQTLASGTYSQRFSPGLTFWNNQIEFTPEMKEGAAALPKVDEKTFTEQETNKLSNKFSQKLLKDLRVQFGVSLEVEKDIAQRVKNVVEQAHQGLLTQFGEIRDEFRKNEVRASSNTSNQISVEPTASSSVQRRSGRRTNEQHGGGAELQANGEPVRRSRRERAEPKRLRF